MPRSFLRTTICAIATLVVALGLLPLASYASPFRAARVTKTADIPHNAATGDFNNDGNLDVAMTTGDSSTNTVQILLGTATGTLGSPVTYRLSAPGNQLTVADFNNDGKQDLAVGTTKGVNVLLGNGDGTFGAALAFDTTLWFGPVIAADFNGDGKMDLLGGGGGNFELHLLLGNGDGTFQSGVAVGSWLYGKLAVGDFNGDGKADFASIFSNIEVHLGNGDGTFQPVKDVSYFNLSGSPISLLAADFNGDGKLDLALLGYVRYGDLTAPVYVFAGNGDGTFKTAKASSVQTDEFPVNFAAADINGDGKMDVVVANLGSNDVSVMTGAGNGNFNSVQHWAAGPRVNDVVVGDFNRDGKPDALALNATIPGTVSMLLGVFSNNLMGARDFAAGYQPWFVTSGDFNGDGFQDLIVSVQYPSAFWISTGMGNGVFAPATEVLLKGVVRQGVAADVNGDGHLDLVLTFFDLYYNSSTVAVLLGNGDGTFQKETDYRVGSGTQDVMVADFTGDGVLDIAVSTVRGNQGILGAADLLVGNGDGTFQSFKTALNLSRSYLNWMTAGDFNGDGKMDLAFSGLDYFTLLPEVLISLGNGDGTFQHEGVAASLAITSVYLTSADLNQDGILDLVSVNNSSANPSNTVSVLLGKGNGTFQSPVDYSAGPTPNMAAIADFSGDGIPDIAISNQAGWVGLLLGQGNGAFSQGPVTQAGAYPYGLVTADFDGNSRPDLAVINEMGNNVTVLLNSIP